MGLGPGAHASPAPHPNNHIERTYRAARKPPMLRKPVVLVFIRFRVMARVPARHKMKIPIRLK